VAVQAIDHVSIDRFTGGALAKALYVEEALVGGTITATITILPPLDPYGNAESWSDNRHAPVVTAFCHALNDLRRGRLAIGAKSLGFCEGDEGEVVWSGPADLVNPWKVIWDAVSRD
jgi:hypothetical protein